MILKEFFGPAIRLDKIRQSDQNENNNDDLFWYIINHDKLHKDYFFPAAKKMKTNETSDEKEIHKLFMPMVNKGCMEYYQFTEMKGKLSKLFPKKMREDLCVRLHDHYRDDLKKNKYRIGK